jgi:hypothetical protein
MTRWSVDKDSMHDTCLSGPLLRMAYPGSPVADL